MSTENVENNETDAKIDMNDDAFSDGYFPIFKSPYNKVYQWSKHLVEINITWRIPPPPMDWSFNYKTDSPVHASNTSAEIVNTSLDVVLDYLQNLKSLSISRYPFAYISDKIGNLPNLIDFGCYGSQMICMPRTMYKLKKLRKFCPYTSYNLHYLPYEISECPLNDTTMSTGALYNNRKNKMLFPPLPMFPNTFVSDINKFIFNKKQLKEYILNSKCILNIEHLNELIIDYAIDESEHTFCSICKSDILNAWLYYVWQFERVGTDAVGLLVKMCPLCVEEKLGEHNFVAMDDSLTLNNASCEVQSIRQMCEYERLEDEFIDIREMRIGKYFGGEYKKENVLKSWVYFWRYNLKMEFDLYELYTNEKTHEVNVKLL